MNILANVFPGTLLLTKNTVKLSAYQDEKTGLYVVYPAQFEVSELIGKIFLNWHNIMMPVHVHKEKTLLVYCEVGDIINENGLIINEVHHSVKIIENIRGEKDTPIKSLSLILSS